MRRTVAVQAQQDPAGDWIFATGPAGNTGRRVHRNRRDIQRSLLQLSRINSGPRRTFPTRLSILSQSSHGSAQQTAWSPGISTPVPAIARAMHTAGSGHQEEREAQTGLYANSPTPRRPSPRSCEIPIPAPDQNGQRWRPFCRVRTPKQVVNDPAPSPPATRFYAGQHAPPSPQTYARARRAVPRYALRVIAQSQWGEQERLDRRVRGSPATRFSFTSSIVPASNSARHAATSAAWAGRPLPAGTPTRGYDERGAFRLRVPALSQVTNQLITIIGVVAVAVGDSAERGGGARPPGAGGRLYKLPVTRQHPAHQPLPGEVNSGARCFRPAAAGRRIGQTVVVPVPRPRGAARRSRDQHREPRRDVPRPPVGNEVPGQPKCRSMWGVRGYNSFEFLVGRTGMSRRVKLPGGSRRRFAYRTHSECSMALLAHVRAVWPRWPLPRGPWPCPAGPTALPCCTQLGGFARGRPKRSFTLI